MNFIFANKNAVVRILRIKPAREVKGGFNEKKLAVGVPHTDREVREGESEVEEEEDDEPLVVKVVAESQLAVEVREVRGGGGGGGRGEREGERLVLPDVVGGERRESGEDLEVQRLEVVGDGGGRGERKVGVNGVEDSVIG